MGNIENEIAQEEKVEKTCGQTKGASSSSKNKTFKETRFCCYQVTTNRTSFIEHGIIAIREGRELLGLTFCHHHYYPINIIIVMVIIIDHHEQSSSIHNHRDYHSINIIIDFSEATVTDYVIIIINYPHYHSSF